jgi:Ca2+/Na+ antiporter
MLLIVASFNEKILLANNGIRILVICTLSLVFVSLLIYIIILSSEKKGIEKNLDENLTEEDRKKITKDFWYYFGELSPYFLLAALAVIIGFIIYFIASNFNNS